ncbi:putative membrane transporter protein [Kibdelosporangium sp. 4NS15]|uniref:Probable membrane transporter protein n=2 Tax=Kibdelosporangium persicum TaxID=2698649 RepID=A0ABX2F356_9PSEU|nr:putative membrane transporter protein [Kibdelosporangium persicum]
MLALMVVIGLAAGVLNYAAASGSLLPFLVMSWLGVPMLVANATTLAATPLSFVRAFWEIKRVPQVMAVPLIFAAAASAFGAFLVAKVVTAEFFRDAVPYVLIVCVAVLLTFRKTKARIDTNSWRGRFSPAATRVLLTSGFSVTSVYAGAFGGSVGVMTLTVFGVVTRWPWPTINAAKNVLCLTTSLVGFGVYATTDLVLWPVAAVVGMAMVTGSLIGEKLLHTLSDNTLRLIVAAATTLAAGGLLWTS